MHIHSGVVEETGRVSILQAINEERDRQDAKWGANRQLSDLLWCAILAEEFGEAAHAALERDFDNLHDELVQTAAVCAAWLESMDARNGSQEGKVL